MSSTVKSSIEAELKENGRLIYPNVGDSMKPFIRQGRELLVIERPKEWDALPEHSLTGKLKKYDVPLYRRKGSHVYVLHRVLAVRDKDYVICGDNRRHKEYGISDQNVIGVLTAVIRNGKEIPVTDRRYRCYVHLWCDFFRVRAGILFVRDMLRRVCRRLFHSKQKEHNRL